jgi:hypothetical protein
MPLLSIIAAVAAFIGGLLVIHGIGRHKRTSELMLQEYRKLLADARQGHPARRPPGEQTAGSAK